MQDKAIKYFNKAVLNYNKSDIVTLIKNNIKNAGPLLCATVNGIDLVGGMCFGFDTGSKRRSVDFMKTYMNINESVAKVLYSCVRCGIAHQGMPKVGYKFFVWEKRTQEGIFLYKDEEGYIWLNVSEFALNYLEAIEKISKEVKHHIFHFPSLPDEEYQIFMESKSHIKNDIMEFCDAVSRLHRLEEEDKFNRGEIDCISSSSAYFPDNTIEISIVIPPEDLHKG